MFFNWTLDFKVSELAQWDFSSLCLKILSSLEWLHKKCCKFVLKPDICRRSARKKSCDVIQDLFMYDFVAWDGTRVAFRNTTRLLTSFETSLRLPQAKWQTASGTYDCRLKRIFDGYLFVGVKGKSCPMAHSWKGCLQVTTPCCCCTALKQSEGRTDEVLMSRCLVQDCSSKSCGWGGVGSQQMTQLLDWRFYSPSPPPLRSINELT